MGPAKSERAALACGLAVAASLLACGHVAPAELPGSTLAGSRNRVCAQAPDRTWSCVVSDEWPSPSTGLDFPSPPLQVAMSEHAACAVLEGGVPACAVVASIGEESLGETEHVVAQTYVWRHWPQVRQIALVRPARHESPIFPHFCALTTSGEVLCSDALNAAQPVDFAVRVEGINDAIRITGSCALRANGVVWCWNAAYKPLAFAASPIGAPPAIDLAGIDDQTMCVVRKRDHKLACRTPGDRFRVVAESADAVAVTASADGKRVCLRTRDGKVGCFAFTLFGAGDFRWTSQRDTRSVVHAGDDGMCVQQADGCVRCFGERWTDATSDACWPAPIPPRAED